MNRAECCSVNHNGETGSTEDESRTDFWRRQSIDFIKEMVMLSLSVQE